MGARPETRTSSARGSLAPGTRIAERFEIERLAGTGGMGEVFRAWDASTQGVVALKVVRTEDGGAYGSSEEGGSAAERFLREAEVLAELRHPGIVRHVAHGMTDDGRLFLAMEWLEGEDLSSRLKRAGLTLRETLALLERLADALAVVHARGIVHRDVKPSNVFLVGSSEGESDLSRPKLLDFGIARVTASAARVVTQTGVVMGTPGYMAPEQARGERVDARSDVFALGCIAFECLTGRPLFVGQHALAILAKIVLEEVPRVRTLRADVPPEVDELLARMLAKEPAARFRDAGELASALRALSHVASSIPAPPRSSTTPSSRAAITDGEQRLVSVVVASARGVRDDVTVAPFAATLPALKPRIELGALREAVRPFGARVEVLQDGTVVATLGSRAAATDQATSAARCALALSAALGPETRIAVATGRGVVGAEWAVGEVIDRVAQLLRRDDRGSAEGGTRLVQRDEIVLDDVTARLLDARFDVAAEQDGFVLRGEAREVDATRTLLGKPVPCIGRERELATLDAALAAVLDEGTAHAVVITAPAGVGKSRLRHEFVRRVLERRDVEVWIARGDPLSAGSSFALLGRAVRVAAGILEGESIESRRQKLRARIARHVAHEQLERVVAFVGEAVGVSFEEELLPSLRAARRDAVLLADQIRRAFEDWIDAETAAHPLLIVLEDLHHGDLPTVRVVDAALRACAERSLLVLALARPEVEATLGDPFRERPRTELRLGELPRRACARIVQGALPSAPKDLVERVVTAAAGNALYLEELIRAHAEGEEELPATLLAMVQARLERLEGEARRVLRAASVFGNTFWRDGVRALLGDEASTGPRASLAEWLSTLVARETVVARDRARFAGEEELAFRHSLVREAAYAMLTDEDRMLGHRLAAEWLERAGEGDALVLAEHWERGGEPLRAIEQYRRAAEQALSGNDLGAAIARVERGVACGADGVTLGALRALEAEARKWRGEFDRAEAAGTQALRLLRPRSSAWYGALAEVVAAVDRQGKLDAVIELASLLRDPPEAEAREAHAIAAVRVAVHLTGAARYDLADALLSAFDRTFAEGAADPSIAARIEQARAMRARLEGAPDRALRHDRAAAEAFDRIGDVRRATNHRLSAAYGAMVLGDFAGAATMLREGLAAAMRLGVVGLVATAKHNLGLALARLGQLDEARSAEEDAIAMFRAQHDPRMEGASRLYLAEILLAGGARDLARAESEVRAAETMLAVAPPLRALALATGAQVSLASGDVDRAIERAREGLQLLSSIGAEGEEGDAALRVTLAEALVSRGELEDARAIVRDAHVRLQSRAARLGAPDRLRFLADVPEHARTVALAERLSAL